MANRKLTQKQAFLMILLFVMGIITGSGLSYIINNLTYSLPIKIIEQVEVPVYVDVEKKILQKYLTRMEINSIMVKDGVVLNNSYSLIPDKKNIIKVIIDIAVKKEIPVNLAISLALAESRLNPVATNPANMPVQTIRSADYGLFQLNNISFPPYNARTKPNGVKNYFDILENTNLALSHLRDLFMKTGSWESAIIFYNSGFNVRTIPRASIRHMENVLTEERLLDKIFNERMIIWKQVQ